ncbi:MAG TPA: aldo/keto reductase [Candidatus Bathyarchaeia archaeon]|nr:aldo/keto reductase [Candidatus Bathyarchaeia archaeon]
MKYRKFGSIDFKVSALGFGAMRLPTRRNSILSRVKSEEAIKIIRSGIDQGINYIDTAWPYHLGASEKIIGQALKDGYREKVFLVTKSPIFILRKPEDFDKYLRQQLDRLQLESVDGYLLHGLSRNRLIKVKELGLLEKLEEAREKGLIKYIGFSFHDTLPVFKEILEMYNWDIVQIQYNYMDTGLQATTEGLKLAYEKGMATVIMEPLKGGRLANPPEEALEIMRKAKSQRTPVDWALQFLWNLPEVSTVISGMGSQKMVDENCQSADKSGINSLNDDDKQIITELAEVFRKKILVPCTTCQYCMPCPSGVDIPDNFALLNNFNQDVGIRKWLTRRKYKKLASKEKNVNLEKQNGNATICTECLECIEKCPQEINIPEELKKVHAILGEKKEVSEYYH